jgi:hypothetical protein
MMFRKARIIALVMGAGLVATVSSADAQIAVVNQKLSVFKQASAGLAGEQPVPVLTVINNQEPFLTPTLLKNALRGDPIAEAMLKQQGLVLQQAIDRRDIAANELGVAITETMKTMNPNDQQGKKRLDEVFAEIQAINKTTNDALLRHDELLALLKEQAAANAQK